jgi:hypothetical protein
MAENPPPGERLQMAMKLLADEVRERLERHPLGHLVAGRVLSSRARGGRRRFGLNVIGIGPGGQPLEHLYDRVGEIPWSGSVRWAQAILESIEHQLERAPRTPPQAVDQRIEGLVSALARRLEKWRPAAREEVEEVRARLDRAE